MDASRGAVPGTRRAEWRHRRLAMEAGREKLSPRHVRRKRHWDTFNVLVKVFGALLRAVGLYRRGFANALDIRLTRLDATFTDLPAAFDGFRVLFMADLHADGPKMIIDRAARIVAEVEADMCVLGGDYTWHVGVPPDTAAERMTDLVRAVRAPEGAFAILGNHDTAATVDAFESMGVRVLVNETHTVVRDGAAIHFTATDDVHYFFTDAATDALDATPPGFRVALVHSAEFAGAVAERGFRLYLAGHTHGGQICLPGGRPIITHLTCHSGFGRGIWRLGSLYGYTSTGTGVSGLPVRFNSRGEVVLVTFRRGPDGLSMD